VWNFSARARSISGTSHTVDVRAVVNSPTAGTRYLPVIGGSVEVDATSQVRRTASITTGPDLWPTKPQDLLTPFGTTCRIDCGIVIPGQDEPEWIPQGLFSLDKTKRTRSAQSTSAPELSLVDMSQRVAEARFEAPTQTVAGATYVAEITRLIREVLGSTWPVIDLTGSTAVCPVMEMQRERWQDGIEKLSDAIGAETFFDQLGQAVIRPQPTLFDAPVWYARTGPGGNILTTDEQWTRDNVYNVWVVSGTRADGTAPVSATVADTDPLSPTYVGGLFGRKPRFYSTPLATTTGQCTAIGQAMLARFQGLGCKVDISLFPNRALDGGDVIDLTDSDLGRAQHIVDKVSIPLAPDGEQPLQTRSTLMLPSES
jgi:hypothetical protein